MPTFAVQVNAAEPSHATDVVRAYVRNGATVETWVAVLTLGQVQPGGAGFPGNGYVGIACLFVPDGSRLVLLDRSPVDPRAAVAKTLYLGGAPTKPVDIWLDVLTDGTVRTGTGPPGWWTSDPPC